MSKSKDGNPTVLLLSESSRLVMGKLYTHAVRGGEDKVHSRIGLEGPPV